MANSLEAEIWRLEAAFVDVSAQWARMLTNLETLRELGQCTEKASKELSVKRIEYDHVLIELSRARKLAEICSGTAGSHVWRGSPGVESQANVTPT